MVAQREENNDRRNSSAGIHGSLEQIYAHRELVTYSQKGKLEKNRILQL